MQTALRLAVPAALPRLIWVHGLLPAHRLLERMEVLGRISRLPATASLVAMESPQRDSAGLLLDPVVVVQMLMRLPASVVLGVQAAAAPGVRVILRHRQDLPK
jgi:hypothetical protein